MKKKFSVSIIVAAVALVAAIVLQSVRFRDVKEGDRATAARSIKLAQQLPPELAGWRGRDEALGPNEAVSNAVERTLNYDDYVYRIYDRGDRQIGVYVAYWGAGRMPLQKVASHTPDRCWTENGWTCEDMRFSETVAAGGNQLMPAQWRRFTPPGSSAKTYVMYWHLVGDRLYDYGDRFNARPDLTKWWRDTMSYAFTGSEAQYFIRVTSNRPFDEFAADPAWTQLVTALGNLGLDARASSVTSKGE